MSNVQVGPNLFLVTLSAPCIAAEVGPGQFVHMKIPGMEGHILRRPFSVYAADAKAGTLDILYQVVGFGSDHMTGLLAGSEAELIGPVGHGWQIPANVRKALVVGGGVGAAPLFMLCERLVHAGVSVDVVLGAQTEQALVCRDRYAQLLEEGVCDLGSALRCATDDGSFGLKGFCTPLVEEALGACGDAPYDMVYVCGPEPLMKIVSNMALQAGVECQVSLEKRMACGVGACLSCVVDTVDGKRRACVDGPVFDVRKVVW